VAEFGEDCGGFEMVELGDGGLDLGGESVDSELGVAEGLGGAFVV
jgi:hypothetical protein